MEPLEQELKLALELGKMGYWRLYVKTDELVWSDELYRIYGLDPKKVKITREIAMSMKLPDDRELFSKFINNYNHNITVSDFEYKLRRSDGEVRFIKGSIRPEYDSSGDIISYFGISQDVTENKEMTHAMVEAKRRFEDLGQLGADWYWEMDKDLRFSYFSDNLLRVTGVDTKRFIGKTRREVGQGTIDDSLWALHLDDLYNHRAFKNFRYKFISDDGKENYWSISGKPIFGPAKTFIGYHGTGSEITEQTLLEEKLRQSQKMQAVGQLTGGIAHDFNNLLAIIHGNTELLKEKLLKKDTLKETSFDTILRAASRGAELTQSMLAFSRKQELKPSVLRLDDQLGSMTILLGRALGETINIKVHHEREPWACVADAGQIENALLNMSLNARDAMPDGGTLTIETVNVTLDDYSAAQADLQPGDYLTLVVSDTGCGIELEDLSHVFEPFFTTKEIGKGTGLGLSMVYGFARQSGGTATVYSEPGKGTTIKLYLPRAHQISDKDALTKKITPSRGNETILVVEDDPDVRTLTVALLGSLGYQVREARNGPIALDILKRDGHVDLLLTDVVLPDGMNGAEVAQNADKIQPGLKVLFMSGYTKDAFASNELLTENVIPLHKPFRKADLSQAVQDTLKAQS